MRRYLGLAFLAAAVVAEPLTGWSGLLGVHAGLFLVGAFLLRGEAGFRRALPAAMAVLVVLSLFAGGTGVGSGGIPGAMESWRSAGSVRLPYEVGQAGAATLNGVGFLATVLAVMVFLLLLPALRPTARPFLRAIGALVAVSLGLILLSAFVPSGVGYGFLLAWAIHLALPQAMFFVGLRLRRDGPPGAPPKGEAWA